MKANVQLARPETLNEPPNDVAQNRILWSVETGDCCLRMALRTPSHLVDWCMHEKKKKKTAVANNAQHLLP